MYTSVSAGRLEADDLVAQCDRLCTVFQAAGPAALAIEWLVEASGLSVGVTVQQQFMERNRVESYRYVGRPRVCGWMTALRQSRDASCWLALPIKGQKSTLITECWHWHWQWIRADGRSEHKPASFGRRKLGVEVDVKKKMAQSLANESGFDTSTTQQLASVSLGSGRTVHLWSLDPSDALVGELERYISQRGRHSMLNVDDLTLYGVGSERVYRYLIDCTYERLAMPRTTSNS